MARCESCCAAAEVRPYGAKGAMVCFKCAMSTPEQRQQAERMFMQQFEAAGPVAVAGSEVGPYPVESLLAAAEKGEKE